jgi:hypothetical protein
MLVSKEPGNTLRAIDILLKLAHLVEVTGHEDGKIEAKAALTSLGKVMAILQGSDVEQSLRLIPGLIGYEVSAWSRSAIIKYDPRVIPMDLWDQFRAIRKDPAVEGIVRQRLQNLLAEGGDSQWSKGNQSRSQE